MPPRPHHRRNREQAAEALGRVAPLVSRWVERLLATTERPLTLAQYLTLQAVAEGKLVGADLARQTAVSPSAVAQLLASLETAGLIARRRGSDDRRRQELALTELGTHALVAAQALVRDELGSLLADLPPPETDALGRLLERLEALLTGAAPPPHPRRAHPPPPPPPRPRPL